MYSSYPGVQPRGVHAPAAELSKAGQNPSRPSVTAGQPHPSIAFGDRTREDDLDRTCPAKEMAAIGSMDASGQDGALKRQVRMLSATGSSSPRSRSVSPLFPREPGHDDREDHDTVRVGPACINRSNGARSGRSGGRTCDGFEHPLQLSDRDQRPHMNGDQRPHMNGDQRPYMKLSSLLECGISWTKLDGGGRHARTQWPDVRVRLRAILHPGSHGSRVFKRTLVRRVRRS